MIERIIEFSIRNRFVVLLGMLVVVVWGIYSIGHTPIDAIPDLSENQVIVFTDWMGRSPQEIEDQVTYPALGQPAGPGRREGGAVVERVQLLDDQHHLRGQDRLLLRPPARARTALDRSHLPAAGRRALPRPRRHGARADLLVHRRGRGQGPRRAAGDPGLVRPLPAQLRPRRGRGRRASAASSRP